MYNYNNPPYPPVSYIQTSPHQFGELRQITDNLATVTRYAGVRKELNKIQDETARHNALQYQAGQLAARLILNLYCGPIYYDDIDWSLLPPNIVSLVKEVSMLTGWSPLAVLMNFLGCISAAMQGRYIVQPDDSWQEPLLLYIALFAESGMQKSLMVKLGKKPLLDFEHHAKQQHNEQAEKQVVTTKAYKIAQDYQINYIITQAAKTHVDSHHSFFKEIKEKAEELAEITKEYSPGKTSSPGLFADSFTNQALLHTMYTRGGGQAIIEPEGNNLLNQLKNHRFDINIILKSYSMENYTHHTAAGKEVYLNNPFLNILLVAQPYIAAQIYGNERFNSIGLTPRFLPCFVTPAQPQTGITNAFAPQSIDEYNRKITAMLDRNYTQSPNRELFTIQVDDEAYKAIKAFQKEMGNWLAQSTVIGAPFMAFIRKAHGTAVRIASVFHAWRYDEPEKYPIKLQDMQAGISITRAISVHADYATDPVGLCAYDNAQKILNWVNRHRHAQFSSRDIAQYSGVKTNDKIFPALDLLERHNYLAQVIAPNHPRLCMMHPHFNYHN